MANIEIFDLPENTTPSLSDVIPNQADSSGGTSSKTTLSNLLKTLNPGSNLTRGCVLIKNSDQSVSASGDTTIEWDSATADFGGYADTSNNKVVIPAGESGLYMICGHIQLQNQNTGSDWYIIPKLTTSQTEPATAIRWGRGMGLQSAFPGKQGSFVQYLAAGDEVQLSINNEDSSYSIRDSGAYLAVVKMSGAALQNAVVEEQIASGDSDLEFNVSSFNGTVEFLLEGVVPATDGADLTLEVSDDNGATWEGANYQWANGYEESNNDPAAYSGNTSAVTSLTSAIYVTGSIGSDTGEGADGRVAMGDPGSSLYKNISYDVSYLAAGGQSVRCVGSGLWKGSTNAITNVRFKFDSGNIESGTIKMIDPTAAKTGEPSLYEDSEVRIPGEWWQDPNNTSDYYPKYRKVVDLGNLPNATTKNVAHGISNFHVDSMDVRGVADNGSGSSYVLPFVSNTSSAQIRLTPLDSTNIIVDTGGIDRSAFTGHAILEYAKTTDTPVTRDQAYGNGGAGTSFQTVTLLEKSADPAEPNEGEAVIWMSDGTGKGDDGDVLIASKAGGVTKYTTLFDHSGGSAW